LVKAFRHAYAKSKVSEERYSNKTQVKQQGICLYCHGAYNARLMSTENFNNYTSKDKRLSDYATVAAHAKRLNHVVQGLLPAALHNQCEAVFIRDGELLIFAHHSGAATRLKMMGQQLIRALNDVGYEVMRVDIKLAVTVPIQHSKNTRQVSETAQATLQTASLAHAKTHPELAAALARLAALGNKKP